MSVKYKAELEWAAEKVSQEQVQRLCNRYYWAAGYCKDKDVVELACGTGQGAGYLNQVSRSYVAGDISDEVLTVAKKNYKNRINFIKIDAHKLPFEDNSKDIIILFEAIYYLTDINKFVYESKRVLRDNGQLLIVTANKDLYAFRPSKCAVKYYGVLELSDLLGKCGFTLDFYGDTPVRILSLRQKVLSPVKKIAVKLNLLPKANSCGERIIKRFVFGTMCKMPNEIDENTSDKIDPIKIPDNLKDTLHKVLFCAASLQKK